ncbi:MAG: DUF1552 domain-containing protein [Fuerstiella sp.]|jgi:hypothetical protein|nr:DUF1552 domain-containing protein [Fuerstiella sp.]MCP4511128.1 DUF1552 domain-containing protein [Fuerstiella sp.]MDG2126434.1 DUF1552 domain-containing protein [Fuerstiella sp.]
MINRTNDRVVSRRRFIAGTGGVALCLPWLESFSRCAGGAQGTGATTSAQRLAFFYLPNGIVRRGFFPGEGDRALPTFAGQNNVWRFEGKVAPVGTHPLTLTPTLAPLHTMRDRVSLITGMDRIFQHGTDSHAQCASCFLTSVAPFEVQNSAYPLARTLDHIVADSIGQTTPYSTLELSCNDHKNNIESIYFDNMSWYGTGHVAPSMRNPRHVYDRLFGTRANTRFRNITDLALGNARRLQQRLSHSDQRKFDEYFEAIRTIEKRMDRIDSMKVDLKTAGIERPAEHLPRNEYIHLMGDLLVTALQTGVTNVGTLMVGPERWTTPTNWEGILDKPHSHHGMTHNPGQHLEDLLKLDRFHVSAWVRLLERMDGIEEANGTTLLDNTIFTLGAGMGDGTTHQYNDLPLIVAGGRGTLKLGSHVQCQTGTPLANLWLTQMHALGIECDSYADSTGTLSAIQA